ncbi:hypothetical protein BJ508DRAFT_378065 [Ascobolus immersus RN42]|uniref:Uncharacterized protein n=1 Tax=Ascobolus immersus RN42 TaxID=1160509 RepID=A0A3N4I432_ASCIM|nr:hypothetical protein BJ508DRAFT_378065 [Ascobolus immersus RN42]
MSTSPASQSLTIGPVCPQQPAQPSTSHYTFDSHSDNTTTSSFSSGFEIICDQAQAQRLKQFARTFVYRWLQNAAECLDVHLSRDATHLKCYQELDRRCRDLYMTYLKFMKLQGKEVAEWFLQNPLFSIDDYIRWISLFRFPVQFSEQSTIERLRAICDDLIRELVKFKIAAEEELRLPENDLNDFDPEPKSLKLPEYITDVKIALRFAENPLRDMPTDDKLGYMGFRPKLAYKLGEEFIGTDKSALEIFLLEIAKKEKDLLSFDSFEEYESAARLFGMKGIFCFGISKPEMFPLVRSRSLSHWLKWAVEGRFYTLEKELERLAKVRSHEPLHSCLNTDELFTGKTNEADSKKEDVKNVVGGRNDETDSTDDSNIQSRKMKEGKKDDIDSVKGKKDIYHEGEENQLATHHTLSRGAEKGRTEDFIPIFKGGWLATLEEYPGRHLITPKRFNHHTPEASVLLIPADFSRSHSSHQFFFDTSVAWQYAKLAQRCYSRREIGTDRVGVLTAWVKKEDIEKDSAQWRDDDEYSILDSDDFYVFDPDDLCLEILS